MATFHELSTGQLRQALQMREQIESLQQKLSALLGGKAEAPAAKAKGKIGRPKGKRTLSPEARAKIAAGQQARWAKVKRATAPAKPAAKAGPQRKGITEEGRAKLSAAMKARWEAKKTGRAAPNAPAKYAGGPGLSPRGRGRPRRQGDNVEHGFNAPTGRWL